MKKMFFVCLFVGLMPTLLSAVPACYDGDMCTADIDLGNGDCYHPPVDCNDLSACTIDSCDPASGCVNAPKNCNDADPCTDDSCDPATGCVHVSKNCDDDNACTNDACNPGDGTCENLPLDCADEHDCTVDSCDPGTGCVNALADTDVVCAPAAGVCDAVEYCDGTHPDCPFDLKQTIECNAKVGDCDVAENCDGIEDTCPIDGVAGDTVVCRDVLESDLCDAVEKCTGSSKDCPADGVAPDTTLCRAAAGKCDVDDYCDGTNKTCADELIALGTECRAAADDCDVAETCPGDAADCPEDAFAALNTPCGDNTDTICNNPDSCDGNGICLDNFAPDTLICNVSTGVCDPAEYCDGAGNCPVDLLAGTETVCRSAVDVCDADEVCDGANVDCPAEDYTAVNGDECADGYDYTADETCSEGLCAGTESIGSCEAAYEATSLPYILESTTIGRPSHIDTYSFNCPLSSAPLGDAVVHVAMDSSKDYTISITRTGGWTGFIAIIPGCGGFINNTTCLNSDSAADSFTYSPLISGNSTIVVESNSAEGDFILTIEEVVVIVPDDTPVPDDDTLLTDEILTDDIVTDDVVTDDVVTDEIVTDDILTDDVVTDEAVSDDGTVLADDTVTPDDGTITQDTDYPITPDGKDDDDTTVTDNTVPDEASDTLLGDEDTVVTDTAVTDTDKPGDDGCGCTVVF